MHTSEYRTVLARYRMEEQRHRVALHQLKLEQRECQYTLLVTESPVLRTRIMTRETELFSEIQIEEENIKACIKRSEQLAESFDKENKLKDIPF